MDWLLIVLLLCMIEWEFPAINPVLHDHIIFLYSLYFLCKKIDESKEIWFLVEAGWNSLYCGFVIAENGDTPGKLNLSYDEIQKYIKVPRGFRKETWWFYWEYLLDNDEKKSPDFLYHNKALFQLFDEEYFSYFIEKSMEQIKNLLIDMNCEDADL